NLNGFPTYNCGKMRECTCGVIEKFIERDSNSKLIVFLMKLSDVYESVRSQFLAMDPLPRGHTVDQCFEKIGYPDWYKGKKAKKSTRMAPHVNFGFDEHFHSETPFDMGSENKVGFGQNDRVDQKLVAPVCQEMMKMFKGKGIMKDKNYACTSHAVGRLIQTNNLTTHFYPNDFMFQDPSIKEIIDVGKGSRCLYICKPTTDQVNSLIVFLSF
nr:hypothetical protein [Tanacetum cinerariifolium]